MHRYEDIHIYIYTYLYTYTYKNVHHQQYEI